MNRLNVLISSVSRKIPLIHAVEKSLKKLSVPSSLIAGDSDKNCIGIYFVDDFIVFPALEELTPELFISLCQYHEINAVIPTRDGELSFFSKNKERFLQEGIHVMVSNTDALQIAADKLLFFQTTSQMGYSPVMTSDNIDDISGNSYVVKERFGAGSRKMGLGLSYDQAVKHAKHLNHPIYQPFIIGKELSIDFYIALNGKGKGVIVRTRDLVISGESQITTSIINTELEEMALSLAEELGLYGHCMFQVIHDSENELYHLLECNPRFGGASTLSLEMGLDSFYWFFLEALGENLDDYPFQREKSEKKLVRYPEDLFLS